MRSLMQQRERATSINSNSKLEEHLASNFNICVSFHSGIREGNIHTDITQK